MPKKKSFTEEHRRKLSEAAKGRVAWNKGKVGLYKASEETKRKISKSLIGNKRTLGHKLTEEHKRKISEAGKGRKDSEEVKRKRALSGMGKHMSMEAREKISKANKGRVAWNKGKKGLYKLSDETKKKLSEIHRGQIPWNKGIKLPQEVIEKMRQAGLNASKEAREKISKANSGEGNGNWRGGLSFKPYGKNWTARLKRLIRERDNHICQKCGKENVNHVHHIDYNKENCSPKNLINLCKVCNSKVNFNREYWTDYFNNKIKFLY